MRVRTLEIVLRLMAERRAVVDINIKYSHATYAFVIEKLQRGAPGLTQGLVASFPESSTG